jgi:hypothetical protein
MLKHGRRLLAIMELILYCKMLYGINGIITQFFIEEKNIHHMIYYCCRSNEKHNGIIEVNCKILNVYFNDNSLNIPKNR